MGSQENEQFVRDHFARVKPGYRELLGGFVDDPDAALDAAEVLFEQMIPGMAYVDHPHHPMALSVFGCSATLAVYLASRELGVDVHEFGAAFLEGMAHQPASDDEEGSADERSVQERFADFAASAEASQRDRAPGEFVYEAFLGDGKTLDYERQVLRHLPCVCEA
jgi:hypothetical protein